MTLPNSSKFHIEPLEQRIAPAGLLNEAGFKTALVGTPLLLTAGEGLSTGGPQSGTYLLYVEKGSALVFTTDLNLNNAIDFNEITGIAAGDGLRLISFVDIHGDIVTNLRPSSALSDSDNDSTNEPLGGDGRVLLNSTIEKIELRSLTIADIGDQNGVGDTDDNGVLIADEDDVAQRLALSSYSIHGNILAGKGFGIIGDVTSGLIIDTTGAGLQQDTFIGFTSGDSTTDFFIDFKPSIGSIKTGTAASGQYFSFGASRGDDIQGTISRFNPAVGQAGGDIANVRAANAQTTFNLDSLEAGGGGIGARGGNITDAQLNGDTSGGYRVIAGQGGRGINGGAGGAILNLSDFGSVTGQVTLQTGDGGNASTGTGGNGGNLTFGTMNLNGGVNILLGNGGNGFVAGGNGASLLSGTFTTPFGTVVVPGHIVATSTDASNPNDPDGIGATDYAIGTTNPVDFDRNGVGDFVFTTKDPGQLVVVMDGNPLNLIYLDGPSNAEALVVADFNGDGYQDIAAASQDEGSFAGISVYLSRYEDVNGDGVVSGTEDLNGNGTNDFIGFTGAIRSVLPSLNSGDNVAGGANLLALRTANAISDLAAGDFDGDGDTDLAVVATYYYPGTGGNSVPVQTLLFMVSDIEDGKPTGQFFADFGVKSGPGVDPVPLSPVFFVDAETSRATGTVIVESTALTIPDPDATDPVSDVVLVGLVGSKDKIFTVGYGAEDIAPVTLGTWALGKVDVNRKIQEGANTNKSLQDATLRDFTIVDVDQDGTFDVAFLTDAPTPDFLVVIAGTDTGAPKAGDKLSDAVGDDQNAGIALSKGNDTQLNLGSPFLGIKTADTDEDGKKDEIVLLNYDNDPQGSTAVEISFVPRATPSDNGATALQSAVTGNVDTTVLAFDVYTNDLNDPTAISYLVGNPTRDPLRLHVITAVGNPIDPPVDPNDPNNPPAPPPRFSFIYNLTDEGIDILAGDGGDALVGKGGAGGSIGGGITLIPDATGQLVLQGALNITFPENRSFVPLSVFQAGDGGNGFSTGGKGGDVAGLVLRRPNILDGAGVSLFGGNGGFGVSGAGGAGGDVKGNSVQAGDTFIGGDGGRGLLGGAGGSVIGNGLTNVYDARTATLDAIGGMGGQGVKAGGAGGSVTDFHPAFSFLFGSDTVGLGSLIYIGGAGGNAVSGPGGKGGSLVNSSPMEGLNTFSGSISLEGGAGGQGTSGGAGGDILTFVNKPSAQDNPFSATFLAGHGGTGLVGNGGVGGSVRSVTAPSIGSGLFSRVLAGNGGDSSGGAGGAGGDLSAVKVDATGGSLALAAGAGGTGLTAGGLGGSVISSLAAVGGDAQSKLLVIAGKGGDVTSVVPNPNEPTMNPHKTFGGKMGKAGDGGSITSFTQELGVSTRVDLIAGNGGDTVNYGTIKPGEKQYVGKGGSVSNVFLRGTAGTLNADVPFKSYNNTEDTNNDGRPDQTVSQFVEDSLRSGVAPLTDALGNVGVIVGTAGRLKAVQVGTDDTGNPLYDSQPATGGTNGSLIDFSARGLAAAVAGSIDRIATIQLVTGLRIGFQVSPGTPFTIGPVGVDKTPPGPDFLDADGNPTTSPVLDGALVDGIVVTKNYVVKQGDPRHTGVVEI